MFIHIQFPFSMIINLITMKSLYMISEFLFLFEFIIGAIRRKQNMKQYMKAGHGNGTFLCVMRLNSQSATELKTTYIIYSW